MRFFRSALLALPLVLAACNSMRGAEYSAESPAGSDHWVEISGVPDWVESPGKKAGTRRFVATGQSNQRDIIASGPHPLNSRLIQRNVTAAFSPLMGEQLATAVAQNLLSQLVLVERACKQEPTGSGNSIPSSLCTAWALWEFPLETSLYAVPHEHRIAARTMLMGIELSTPAP